MLSYFVGNSLWYLIKQSDFLSKFILLLLLFMSIICWTIFIGKLLLFHLRKQEAYKVNNALSTARSFDDLVAINSHISGTIGGYLIAQTLGTVHTLKELQSTVVARNWEVIQYNIDQTAETLIAQEESYLPILSTSAAVAPLLGLFGTVWGLVHAFIHISEKQAADITVVAPGIAEALITTLAGLMVAIPALVMYNYLLIQVRHLEAHIGQLADRVTIIMHQTLGE